MSDLDDFKATYFDECSELLNELEEQFAAIEAGERDADRLNAVFRAIHSIKGGAGAFGFTAMVGFAHAYETLLDYVRDGRVELTDDVVVLCIRANDIIADHVKAAQTGEALAADYGMEEKIRFDALARGETGEDEDMGGEHVEEFDIEFVPVMVNLEGAGTAGADTIAPAADGDLAGSLGALLDDDATVAAPAAETSGSDSFAAAPMQIESGHWEVKFTPHRALYARANDPLLLFRELAVLGEMHVRAVMRELPPLAAFEPFEVYCSWEITLVSATLNEAMIREVFEFVDGDCDIEVTQLGASVVLDVVAETAAPAATATPPAADNDADDLLALADDEVVGLLDFDKEEPPPPSLAATAQDSFEEPPAMSFAELAASIAPPPPKAALTINGEPIVSAASGPPPGRQGTPAACAAALARPLSPMRAIASGEGPTKISPASAQALAKPAFSDKKP